MQGRPTYRTRGTSVNEYPSHGNPARLAEFRTNAGGFAALPWVMARYVLRGVVRAGYTWVTHYIKDSPLSALRAGMTSVAEMGGNKRMEFALI